MRLKFFKIIVDEIFYRLWNWKLVDASELVGDTLPNDVSAKVGEFRNVELKIKNSDCVVVLRSHSNPLSTLAYGK
jgi:hypothetical protein